MSRVFAAALLAGLVCLAAACGSSSSKPSAAELAHGKRVFQSAGCGRCHTFAPAGATGGFVGGTLDGLKLKDDFVEQRVRFGGGGMPRFQGKLSDADIKAVAEFVANASGS